MSTIEFKLPFYNKIDYVFENVKIGELVLSSSKTSRKPTS